MVPPTAPEAVRLQKIIADAKNISRREAEELVREGAVTVNGKTARLGDKAVLGKDHIKVNGKLLHSASKKIVIAFFKPRGMLTHAPALEPEQKGARGPETIVDFLTKVRERVLPVGRLDRDAEGIVLLTNDGELMQRLLKPKYEVEKVYRIKVDGELDESRLKRLSSGVQVEGKRMKPLKIESLKKSEGKHWIKVVTSEPKNRHLRKMCEAVGRPVDKLQRDAFGGITLRGLERGEYRYLSDAECAQLRKLVGL